MALSQFDALTAVREVLMGQRVTEASRLERLHYLTRPVSERRHLSSRFPTVQIPQDAPPLMRELARKSETNYLYLLVKTFRQVMKVDGYLSQSDEGATEPWFWWQRNRMDSDQTGLVDAALTYGVAYATALPGTFDRGRSGPQIRCYSPLRMTALYQDPTFDEWPMLAVESDGQIVKLYDDELVYTFGVESGPVPVQLAAGSLPYGPGSLSYITTEAHETGVCPVVRYRDRNLLAGEESLGIVEPLLTVHQRITESTFQALVTDYFQAFKQRYLIGWVPKSEKDELKTGAGLMWYLDEDPADINIGELPGGTVSMEQRNAAIRDFAAIGQIPAQALGIDGISNISDATLAGLEAAKNREASEITTSLGESHEQLMRLCAYIDGNQAAADDYNSEVRWRDFEARSFATTVDGLVKLVQGLGLDPAIALEDVPGMTEQRLIRAQASIRKSQGASLLETLRQASAAETAVPSGDTPATP